MEMLDPALYYAIEAEKKEKLRQEHAFQDILYRLKIEAGIVSCMSKGTEKKVDVLRCVPGIRYSDLRVLRNRLKALTNQAPWCPENVMIQYDEINHIYVLKNS